MRQRVLSRQAIDWAVREYANGTGPGMVDLAKECNVAYSTLHRALRDEGVTIRRQGQRRKVERGVR